MFKFFTFNSSPVLIFISSLKTSVYLVLDSGSIWHIINVSKLVQKNRKDLKTKKRYYLRYYGLRVPTPRLYFLIYLGNSPPNHLFTLLRVIKYYKVSEVSYTYTYIYRYICINITYKYICLYIHTHVCMCINIK